MNIEPLLDALGVQEDAARLLADELRTEMADLQSRLRAAETHLEHLAITRTTVTALADRIPTRSPSPDLPDPPATPASSTSATRQTARCEPETSAKHSTTNSSRRTSKAPEPS
ncbi:hypothetical protein LO772_07950 [Yinghuangia sp. ASG 101]|uniref:hypothetical protein n=1 Tax=Yinghuangia sp. ASG 101 TaxID=2896848 RepID=UPI001E2EB2E3|nr:hypothetical protein [Yinghuangia sp. ASG 101]UGQ12032.1 hypothetical protein LO772_35680 [Yinghuangia sp. ASG 101]UGQ13526.1 hypothetical protein LO772_07950 [Yinghuangia sp. ASG 101]